MLLVYSERQEKALEAKVWGMGDILELLEKPWEEHGWIYQVKELHYANVLDLFIFKF
jgi:hypothetical protein